jgi:hypothetical protein
MATGIQSTSSKRGLVVRLLEGLTAANSTLPTVTAVASEFPTSTEFFDLSLLGDGYILPEDASIRISESAGSGALSIAYARLWIYDRFSGKSYPAGIGTDASKGKLNNGAALGITATGLLRHTEPLLFVGHADGIQVELGAIGGSSSPAFHVDLWIPRYARR